MSFSQLIVNWQENLEKWLYDRAIMQLIYTGINYLPSHISVKVMAEIYPVISL